MCPCLPINNKTPVFRENIMTNVGYYVLLISGLIPGLALVASGLSKWLNLTWFAGVLLKYKVLPRFSVKLLAVLIPAGELTLGILLMVDHRRQWPAYGALFLFILFTGAVVTNLLRGRSTLPCGCSGFLNKAKIRWGILARNMGFGAFLCLVLKL